MQPPHFPLAQARSLLESGHTREGLAILNRLAGAGEPGALAKLADLRWRGQLLPQDPALARDLLRRASAAGHVEAGLSTTNLLASGIAGPRDWPGALARLATEAAHDPARAAALAVIEAMALTPDGNPATLPADEPLSDSPSVRHFPGLFSTAECAYLRAAAEPRYRPSAVLDAKGRLIRDPVRSSDGSLFHWLIEDPAVHAINRRLAAASGTDAGQAEPLQILRYRPGEQYRQHLDFLPGAANQRVLTALIYLNDDYAGGETLFLRTGLRVRGRIGDALVFRNVLAGDQSSADPMSLHAGLPVTGGVKYLASRWIHAHRLAP